MPKFQVYIALFCIEINVCALLKLKHYPVTLMLKDILTKYEAYNLAVMHN